MTPPHSYWRGQSAATVSAATAAESISAKIAKISGIIGRTPTSIEVDVVPQVQVVILALS